MFDKGALGLASGFATLSSGRTVLGSTTVVRLREVCGDLVLNTDFAPA